MAKQSKPKKQTVKEDSLNEKNPYEYMSSYITYLMTLLVLMGGTVYISIKNITTFSLVLIFIFALVFFANIIIAIYAKLSKNNKMAKLAIYLFVLLLAIYLIYSLTFLANKLGLKVVMDSQIPLNATA